MIMANRGDLQLNMDSSALTPRLPCPPGNGSKMILLPLLHAKLCVVWEFRTEENNFALLLGEL
jgi:hypothetical protein